MSTTLKSYVLDPAERAASTFVEQFVVLILPTLTVGAAIHYQAWGAAADTAAFAAVLSLITSILTFKVPALPVGADLGWRVVKTFLQSFFAVLAADQFTHSVMHADWRFALATAIPVALTALLKGLAALAAPWSQGASLLPTNLDSTSIQASQLDYPAVRTSSPSPQDLELGDEDDTYTGTVIVPDHHEVATAPVAGQHAADPLTSDLPQD